MIDSALCGRNARPAPGCLHELSASQLGASPQHPSNVPRSITVNSDTLRPPVVAGRARDQHRRRGLVLLILCLVHHPRALTAMLAYEPRQALDAQMLPRTSSSSG